MDTTLFRPASADERLELRRRLDLPRDRFLMLLSSRISHEKDPETVLRAAAMVRARGVDAVVLNLGGGHREFLALARRPGARRRRPNGCWRARPSTPWRDWPTTTAPPTCWRRARWPKDWGSRRSKRWRARRPVVATAIGGMAAHLAPYAALTPRRDAGGDGGGPARAWPPIRRAARADAARGREYVQRHWTRDAAFRELRAVLAEVVEERLAARAGEEHA